MIKFFRIIRQKLIDAGNLKRYLIYAIGEILLVQDLELSEKIFQNNNIFIVDQQYGNVVKEIGYYFFNNNNFLFKAYNNLDQDVDMASSQLNHYNSNLASISKKMLTYPSNQLVLMNALNQRANVAIVHYQRAITLEVKTKNLIEDIEKELND